MSIGVIGFIYKCLSNDDLLNDFLLMPVQSINSRNESLKALFINNDIGKLNFLTTSMLDLYSSSIFVRLYELVFNDILDVAYEMFKNKYPGYSYGNFVKSDLYYYNHVIPVIYDLLKNDTTKNKIKDIFAVYFDLSEQSILSDKTTDAKIKSDYTQNMDLQEELIHYRKGIYYQNKCKIPAYEVFTNMQLSKLLNKLPKTKEELINSEILRSEQIKKYGADIIEIILKHVNQAKRS